MNLSVEDLKIIRLALTKYPLSKQVIETLENVDAELAKHNLKATYKSLPKQKYERQRRGEYIFEPISNQ